MRIGIISDTHGLLRPQAVAALSLVDAILHTGDVGDPAIIRTLRAIAPLTAIRGNVDVSGVCAQLPAIEVVGFEGLNFLMLHSVANLDLDPTAAGFAAVLSGHTHKPSIEWKAGVLYFNPGSAGPRRFSLPVSIGILTIAAGTSPHQPATLHPELITLL